MSKINKRLKFIILFY